MIRVHAHIHHWSLEWSRTSFHWVLLESFPPTYVTNGCGCMVNQMYSYIHDNEPFVWINWDGSTSLASEIVFFHGKLLLLLQSVTANACKLYLSGFWIFLLVSNFKWTQHVWSRNTTFNTLCVCMIWPGSLWSAVS